MAETDITGDHNSSLEKKQNQIEGLIDEYNLQCKSLNEMCLNVKQVLDIHPVGDRQLKQFFVELQSAFTLVQQLLTRLQSLDPDYVRSASEIKNHEHFLALCERLDFEIGKSTTAQVDTDSIVHIPCVESAKFPSVLFNKAESIPKVDMFTGGSAGHLVSHNTCSYANSSSLCDQIGSSNIHSTSTSIIACSPAHPISCTTTTAAITVPILSTSVSRTEGLSASLKQEALDGISANSDSGVSCASKKGKKSSSSLPDFDTTRRIALKEMSENIIYNHRGKNLDAENASASNDYLSNLPGVDTTKLVTDSFYLGRPSPDSPDSHSGGKSIKSVGSRISNSLCSKQSSQSETSSVLIEAMSNFAQQSYELNKRLIQENREQHEQLIHANLKQNNELLNVVVEQTEKQTKQLMSSLVTVLDLNEKGYKENQSKNNLLVAETQKINSAFLSQIQQQFDSLKADNHKFCENVLSTMSKFTQNKEQSDTKDVPNETFLKDFNQKCEENYKCMTKAIDQNEKCLSDLQDMHKLCIDTLKGKIQNIEGTTNVGFQSLTVQLARQNIEQIEQAVRAIRTIIEDKDEENQSMNSKLLSSIEKVNEMIHTQMPSLNTPQSSRPLPPLAPSVFDGDPARYISWRRQISLLMETYISENDKLSYLEQYLSEDLQWEYRIYLQDVDVASSAKVLSKLDERFGNRLLSIQSYAEELENWPSIEYLDSESLRAFADFLSQIESVASCRSHFDYLNQPKQVKSLCDKLPEEIASMWVDVVGDHKENNCGQYPNFSMFVKFVSKCSKKANDPIYSASQSRMPNPGKIISSPKCRATHSTGISENDIPISSVEVQERTTTLLNMAADEITKFTSEMRHTLTALVDKVNGKPQSPNQNQRGSKYRCPHCESHFHYVHQCPEFAQMSPKDRVNRTLELKLCLRCLKPRHEMKGCRLSLACTHCNSQSHNSLLHYTDCEKQIHEILFSNLKSSRRHS